MQLVVIAGVDRDRVFNLSENKTLLVGRSNEAEIQLTDPRVSRKHCLIRLADNTVTVTDCESAAGTLINGRRVSSQRIFPGDLLTVATTDCRLQSESIEPGTETERFTAPPMKTLPMVLSDDLMNLIGKTIHNYLIESVIATGRNGTVFLAKHIKLDKPLAVKVLWPSLLEDEVAVQRFVRAMVTMQPVQHPNIVRVYNAGKSSTLCWLAMERVVGKNAAYLIHRIGIDGMLDWQMAFRITVQITRALVAAAEFHIVHRNITPKSILIQSGDKVAKLGDLMLAKALGGESRDDITSTGELVGELPFMSPEATHSSKDVDARSDIYSLGATVYTLLSGSPPFEHPSLQKLIEKIRHDPRKPPERRGLSMNDQFERILMKMLEINPVDRYQTPELLLKDLELVAKYQGIAV